MPLLSREMLGVGIGHHHGQQFVWAPKRMGVIATIENAKAASAMASTRAVVAGAMGTAWPQLPSRDIQLYPLPTTYFVESDAEPGLAERFEALADEWEADTAFTSALSEMVLHQNYQDIIGMGLPALPYVFERLRKSPARWFWALRAIVGHDVAASSTTAAEAVERWLDWGHANGYIE